MKAMQLIQNVDSNKFESLTESYDRDFLSGNNKYPQTPLEAYNLLKGWHKSKAKQTNNKVGVAFNTLGDEEDGDALVNDGSKQKCTRCGRMNHTADKYFAKRHTDMEQCCTLMEPCCYIMQR